MINFRNFQWIFFDFDGVVKESVSVKTDAFMNLFGSIGPQLKKKIRDHHEANGGLSRYEKIPVYLSWLGLDDSQKSIDRYAEKFSQLVRTGVIKSEWVPGARELIVEASKDSDLFVVSATPQNELYEILEVLCLNQYFEKVFGSPTPKDAALKALVDSYNVNRSRSVMIGDSESDYLAAESNGIPFILRRTDLNKNLQSRLDCKQISNFLI